eukprot:416430-Lingulodinium_polyedra.AAC.1
MFTDIATRHTGSAKELWTSAIQIRRGSSILGLSLPHITANWNAKTRFLNFNDKNQSQWERPPDK